MSVCSVAGHRGSAGAAAYVADAVLYALVDETLVRPISPPRAK